MVSREEFERANRRAKERSKATPIAVDAHFDRRNRRVVITFNSGAEFRFPADRAEGLETATPSQLQEIEITPSGLGVYFPRLDTDFYIPALLEGIFGSQKWMAARLGAKGGRVKSLAKSAAARANGRLGGRPPKLAAMRG